MRARAGRFYDFGDPESRPPGALFHIGARYLAPLAGIEGWAQNDPREHDFDLVYDNTLSRNCLENNLPSFILRISGLSSATDRE
jgi:hypothetical protein